MPEPQRPGGLERALGASGGSGPGATGVGGEGSPRGDPPTATGGLERALGASGGSGPGATGKAHAAIVAAAVLFGSTFVVVQDAIDDVEPLPFLALRFVLAGLVVGLFACRRPKEAGALKAGVVCGVALAGGYVLQTVGLQYTTSTVSAFITYLLVVVVPVISAAWLRTPPDRWTVVGIGLAVGGLYLLTGKGFDLGKGELLTVACAVAFALHIVLLSHYAPRFDVVRLNAVQLSVVGLVCLGPGALTGGYAFSTGAVAAAVYTAVAASAAAMALQIWGQRVVGANRTSLLLMIEPVAAAVLGAATGDRLGWTGALGAAFILLGIAVSELPLLTGRSEEASMQPLAAPAEHA